MSEAPAAAPAATTTAPAPNATPQAPSTGETNFGVSDTTQTPATPKDSPQTQQAGMPKTDTPAQPSWVEGLPTHMQEYVQSKHFQSPQDVVDSYINLEKLKGVPQDRLLKLPESPDDASWGDVYTKLGKPVTPEGYNIESGEGDQGFADWAKNAFHGANLTVDQAQKVIDQYNKFVSDRGVESSEQYKKSIEKQEMELKKEWGQAYHQNVAKAQNAAKQFGIPAEAVNALEKAIGFDGTMKFMHGIGEKIGEGGYISGQNAGFGENILTPQQANARIERLKSDPGFTKKYLAGDLDAKDELQRLHKMAYGD